MERETIIGRLNTTKTCGDGQKYTKGYVKKHIEIYERNLDGSPYNRIDNALSRHLMPKSKASSASNGLHLVEPLAKMIPWTAHPPKPHRLLHRILVTLQSSGRALLMKIVLAYIIEHREFPLMPN